MEKYRHLPHTADGKFQAFGSTLEEAFTNAALAVASLMWDWERIEKKTVRPVRAEGKDLEQLLYRFLEEILYLLDTENFLLAAVEGLKIETGEGVHRLEAVFRGDRFTGQHEVFGDVKAVTYHEMEIKKNDHFTIQVVVDM
ncbi:MAG: archease [Candidatus Aminicenantales bacterium]